MRAKLVCSWSYMFHLLIIYWDISRVSWGSRYAKITSNQLVISTWLQIHDKMLFLASTLKTHKKSKTVSLFFGLSNYTVVYYSHLLTRRWVADMVGYFTWSQQVKPLLCCLHLAVNTYFVFSGRAPISSVFNETFYFSFRTDTCILQHWPC